MMVNVPDHRGLPGEPKTPEHRAAIAASVKRTLVYRRDFAVFFALCLADTPDEAERRFELTKLARSLIANAPDKAERKRWNRYADLLDRGFVFAMKTYLLTKPEKPRV